MKRMPCSSDLPSKAYSTVRFNPPQARIFCDYLVILLILLGITFLLYCLTMRNLFLRSSKTNSPATSWKLIGFLTVQQIALLIAVLSNIQFCVLAFVYHRDTPGGPVAYQILHSNVAPAYASIASFSVCNWLQDAVLVRSSLQIIILIANFFFNSYIDS